MEDISIRFMKSSYWKHDFLHDFVQNISWKIENFGSK